MKTVSDHLENLIAQKGTLLWGGYVNMLKHLETVFLSPKHWVLEFIQNAEDAGARKFSIHLEENSLWILNDGKEFTDDDFFALCDVDSRKLPSLGFRGYIGIGFKSIFRITDGININSGKLHFKFDRNHWPSYCKEKGVPLSNWPWEILPLEIPVTELPEGYNTAFHVPLASQRGQEVVREITQFLSSSFPKEAILLLKSVQVIEVKTPEVSFIVRKKTEEQETFSGGTQEVVVVKKESDRPAEAEEEHYLVFRKTAQVPHEIQQDRETERVRRSQVVQREIGLIFGLDSAKDLRLLSGKITGVYSFLPVEGEQTGLPFGIFGDFIPQLGRDQVNYGVKWNHWMCDEMVEFFQQVIRERVLAHPWWKFFPAELLNQVQRGYISSQGVKELWDPKLRDPIKQFFQNEALYPDEDGELHKLSELVIVSADVIPIFGKELLKAHLPKKIAHPSIAQQIWSRSEEITIVNLQDKPELCGLLKGQPEKLLGFAIESVYNLLYKREMLEPLVQAGKMERLIEVYRRLAQLNAYRITGRRSRETPLYMTPFVLAENGNFYPPNQMVALEMSLTHLPEFLRTVLPSLKEKKLLHPEIAKDHQAVKALENCHLTVVDTQRALNEVEQLVKGINTPDECPNTWKYPDDLIQVTLFLVAGGEGLSVERLVADDRTLRGPRSLFVPGAPLDWKPLWDVHLLPGFQPVHQHYLRKEWLEQNGLQWETVHQYLEKLGTHGFHRDGDRPLIQVAAENIAKRRLEKQGHRIADVTQRDKLGYDLECHEHCGKVYEVKGMAEPRNVTLEESEFEAARQKKENYVVICVYNLPTYPDRVGYKEIPNPGRIWQPKGQATIAKDEWLESNEGTS